MLPTTPPAPNGGTPNSQNRRWPGLKICSLPVVGLVPAIFWDGRPPVLGRSLVVVAHLKLADRGHSRWGPTVAVRSDPSVLRACCGPVDTASAPCACSRCLGLCPPRRETLEQHPAPETDTLNTKVSPCSSLVTLQGVASPPLPVGFGQELHGLSLHKEQGTAPDVPKSNQEHGENPKKHVPRDPIPKGSACKQTQRGQQRRTFAKPQYQYSE